MPEEGVETIGQTSELFDTEQQAVIVTDWRVTAAPDTSLLADALELLRRFDTRNGREDGGRAFSVSVVGADGGSARTLTEPDPKEAISISTYTSFLPFA